MYCFSLCSLYHHYAVTSIVVCADTEDVIDIITQLIYLLLNRVSVLVINGTP